MYVAIGVGVGVGIDVDGVDVEVGAETDWEQGGGRVGGEIAGGQEVYIFVPRASDSEGETGTCITNRASLSVVSFTFSSFTLNLLEAAKYEAVPIHLS